MAVIAVHRFQKSATSTLQGIFVIFVSIFYPTGDDKVY